MDSAYSEMVGECDFADVHMKKGLRPPRINTITSDIRFDLGDIKVDGEIIRPEGNGPFTTVVIVHGRGCGSKDDWSQRPEVLAQYGLAVITYDKRGNESTGYPCEMTNMRMHAKDLVKVTQKVKSMKFTEDVGYLAYSAGGWVAPMAAAQIDIDFMATIVGPSTSVKQQQLDCSVYYVRDQLKLDDDAVNEALEYCELEFSDDSPEIVFKQMKALLDSARVNGWIDVLEDSDIIGTPEGLDSLWVRRNRYDPAEDLQAFEGPFLSVIGGSDFVVPYKENIARFKELFDNVSKTNYRITMIPSANHGMEHWHKSRDLGYESSIRKWHTYFKFDRVAPGAMDEFISFMREYGFID
ncbi:MAG: alpha/beta fold hydrolase [Flavobacteriales bacterium]|nr:alpha/beta fold hydrolase [Flavobacteriales bacterium]